MSDDCACGCCETCAPATPTGTNRPGLAALAFRAAAYGPTLAAMREALSEQPALAGLTTRDPGDAAIALLDAWACLSELLSFYNERLVNESYLGTCVERGSAAELARLVGYSPRPGVAADAYLAFSLDDLNKEAELDVPADTLAYSQPGPGETMQPFTTLEPLRGRPRWSAMRARPTRPQMITPDVQQLFFKGLSTSLRPGDKLLFAFQEGRYSLRTVHRVELQVPEGRTLVRLVPNEQPPAGSSQPIVSKLLKPLLKAGALSAGGLPRLNPRKLFATGSGTALDLARSVSPALAANLGAALAGSVRPGPTNAVSVYAMRAKGAIHGHNAPRRVRYDDGEPVFVREWGIDEIAQGRTNDHVPPPPEGFDSLELPLDAVYDQLLPGSMVVLTTPDRDTLINPALDTERAFDAQGHPLNKTFGRVLTVQSVATLSRSAYNLPARVTTLTLDGEWRVPDGDPRRGLTPLRAVTVYAQSELLELAEEPDSTTVGGDAVDLDGFYDGFAPGRRLIVAGERADLGGLTGVRGTELVQIASVEHTSALVGGAASAGALFTRITLAEPLEFSYIRTSVQIHGNVAHATHGQRREETLGAGDATRPIQQFTLRQPPLTYRPAPTAVGVASTLEVQVNELRWHPADEPARLGPADRRYLLSHADDGAVTLTFGLGARLPTGRDNVRASYLSGIGAAGNVRPGQISVLGSRPSGAMGVTNPLPASGGAEPDGLGQIRIRAPLSVTALDRPVSLQDYADFARGFAGIDKALAVYNNGTVHLTVAAVDDAPLSKNSALLHHLRAAFTALGGEQPTIHVRRARLLALKARIQLQPDVVWDALRPRIEAALLDRFGFDRRELGKPAYASAAIAGIQGVPGVAAVDLDVFDSLDPGSPDAPTPPDDLATAALALFAATQSESQGRGTALTVAPVDNAATLLYLPAAHTGLILLERAKASDNEQ